METIDSTSKLELVFRKIYYFYLLDFPKQINNLTSELTSHFVNLDFEEIKSLLYQLDFKGFIKIFISENGDEMVQLDPSLKNLNPKGLLEKINKLKK